MRTLAIVWTAVVVIGLLAPSSALPDVPKLLAPDKLIHLVLFGTLGALWTLAFPDRARLILVAGIGLAVATEIGQGMLTIGREPDLYDAIADAVGLAIGVGVARWIGARKPAA